MSVTQLMSIAAIFFWVSKVSDYSVINQLKHYFRRLLYYRFTYFILVIWSLLCWIIATKWHWRHLSKLQFPNIRRITSHSTNLTIPTILDHFYKTFKIPILILSDTDTLFTFYLIPLPRQREISIIRYINLTYKPDYIFIKKWQWRSIGHLQPNLT